MIGAALHIPSQQQLSTSFFASLQNSLPFFCTSQQHVFTSFPVNVQVIFSSDNTVPTSTITTNRVNIFRNPLTSF